MNEKELKESSSTTGKAGAGQNVTTKATGTVEGATGANVVLPPTDAKAGEPQGETAGFEPVTLGETDAEKAEVKAPAGFPVKIVKEGHTHEGSPVKKGATLMVDMATYRWLLENKVGEPGSADDVGLEVTKKGEAIKPETDEEAVARLEAEFAAKQTAKEAE
jgi:hypothetical protein